MRWLVDHAESVFVVSEKLGTRVESIGRRAEMLRFARHPAVVKATAPENVELRIGLIGNCGDYIDGIRLLDEALLILRAQGDAKFRLRYVGRPRITKGWCDCLNVDLEFSGFGKTSADKDLMLAACHVGYLPGPSRSPDDNLRSRYSIPSRVLDFMALGLPIVGPVHPESATAIYMRAMGLGEFSMPRTAEALGERLQALRDPKVWSEQSELSLRAYEAAMGEHAESMRRLVAAMDGA